MSILSKRLLLELERTYRNRYEFRPYLIDEKGVVLNCSEPLDRLSEIRNTRARALEECVHWGEPYVFLLLPGVISWVIALVDEAQVQGGLIGGEVISKHAETDPSETVQHLTALGLKPAQALQYVTSLPTWGQGRIREAIQFLNRGFYVMSGWKPRLWEENFSRALQQREVAHAIHEQKKTGKSIFYPVEKERLLLAMVKNADRKGAQTLLNDWLGALFYQNPRLPLLRARAIELLGHLSRSLLEDSPLLECLVANSCGWAERLMEADSFEQLCLLMDQAVADFIASIQTRQQEHSNQKVAVILHFLSTHYRQKITLKRVAQEVGLSTFRTSHLVKEVMHKPLFKIVQEIRMQKAQDLLWKTSKSCTEIAYEVGYQEQSYFIKHFKRHTGVTPTRFRRRGLSEMAPARVSSRLESPNLKTRSPKAKLHGTPS